MQSTGERPASWQQRIVRFLGGVGAIGNTTLAVLMWNHAGHPVWAWIWLTLGLCAVIACLVPTSKSNEKLTDAGGETRKEQ